MKQCLVLLSLAIAAFAADAPKETAEKVELIKGDKLSEWKDTADWCLASEVSLNPANNKILNFKSGQGIMLNGPKGKTKDIYSAREFGDCEVHVEFLVAPHSNSGVYLQGRYEVQILDSYGKKGGPSFGDCGGIYEAHPGQHGKDAPRFMGQAPKVNASLPPGQWQTFDITFRAPRFDAAGKKIENARFVKVVHNEKVVQENVELITTTGGALAGEKAQGPLRLQGDHGPVAFRNMYVIPKNLDDAKAAPAAKETR